MEVIEHASLPPYRLPRRGLGERWTVRIPPHFSDCVAFLCAQRKGRAGGTAFFIELDEGRDTWTYLITAQHSLEEGLGRDIHVRVNTHPSIGSDLGFEDIQTRKEDWFQHNSADVAAIISPIDSQRHAIQKIPADLFIDNRYRFDAARLTGRGNPALEAALKSNFPDGIDVQVGDEVFAPGLFLQSAGKNRNLPVVRFGNIARMPEGELLALATEHKTTFIRGYLAETHSWGGYSGSPVFWHYEYNFVRPIIAVPQGRPVPSRLALDQRPPQPEPMHVMTGRGWATALLGLVSGHYGIPTKAKDRSVETELNAGIGIVTPAANIVELLMREDVVEQRQKRKLDAEADEPRAIADSALSDEGLQRTLAKNEKDRIAIPILTKQQFFDDLTKATRKRGKRK